MLRVLRASHTNFATKKIPSNVKKLDFWKGNRIRSKDSGKNEPRAPRKVTISGVKGQPNSHF